MKFSSVEQRLSQIARTDEQNLATGVRLYGHVPAVAPEAYLFTLYPGLTEDELRQAERRIRRPLPAPYNELLRYTNGMSLFVGNITIFGMRYDYARTGDRARQPIDMVDPNTLDLPPIPRGGVVIGGYREDGSHLYMLGDDPQVFWVGDEGEPVLKTWPSLESFLLLELERLAKLVGSDYRKLRYDSETNTLPDPQST